MSAPARIPLPDRRRIVPVRLTEIPLDRRLRAAHEAIKTAADARERAEILLAAAHPSDRVYWVAA